MHAYLLRLHGHSLEVNCDPTCTAADIQRFDTKNHVLTETDLFTKVLNSWNLHLLVYDKQDK